MGAWMMEKEKQFTETGDVDLVQLVLPDIYRIEVPLPNNPLKAINSYVIKGHKRNLVIDTGMNRVECHEALVAGLSQIDVDLENTDFLITHYHIDHCGLVSSLINPGSKVYTSEDDGTIINNGSGPNAEEYWIELQSYAGKHGFPRELLWKAIVNHPGYVYKPERKLKLTPVSEGDIIQVGIYNFQCVQGRLMTNPGDNGLINWTII
jgi:glyoxylase-like metal-dependent hydrolase (beta-lactamase superfamily II)